jgi:hypothetical protein
MKKFFIAAVLALILATGTVVPTWAASNEVMVVYQGTTQVNRETYNFLRRNLASQGVTASVSATQDLKSVKAGAYKAVLVLSTGVSGGLDPAMKAFIDTYPAKSELFVVSLLKDSKSQTVQVGKVTSGGQGVDVVTAASTWSEGSDKMTYIGMHQEWIIDFVAFLKAR